MSDATSSTQVDTTIGGEHSKYASMSRRYLNLVNKFFDIGLYQDVDLPMIAVVGSQSTGKSSLIEGISSVGLPRAAGTCTRLPIECRLSHSELPWKCSVSLRFTTSDGKNKRPEVFGGLITDEAEVKERIERAQAAVLNPAKHKAIPDHFLECPMSDLQTRELSFSEDLVCLEISGPKVPDLTFIDLPGLIRDVGSSGNEEDISLIEKLVTQYIEKSSCVILLTISCETDAANQGAHSLARRYDPEGERTVGVLTKPDRIPVGDEERWIDYLRGKTEPLNNGWFCVKQPELQGSRAGVSRSDAAFQEGCFFTKTSPWLSQPFDVKKHLQTKHLVQSLEHILSARVSKRVPELAEELERESKSVGEELQNLGPVVSESTAVSEVHKLIRNFLDDVKAMAVPATMEQAGLLNELHPVERMFKATIRATAPDFRPWDSDMDSEKLPSLPFPDFLGGDTGTGRSKDGAPIFINTVGSTVDRARVAQRGLPDNAPSSVSQTYVRQSVSAWEVPTLQLVDGFLTIIKKHVGKLIGEQFSQYQHGNLFQSVNLAVTQHLTACREEALSQVKHLLKVEARTYTNNDTHHRDFKNKFKAFYKAHRASTREKNRLFETLKLKPFDPNAARAAETQMGVAMEGLKANYAKLGVSITDYSQLAMVIPDDEAGAALDIMASASAFFEVAYRRFTDYAPQFVYEELVGELHGRIEAAVFEAVNLRGSDVVERCKKFLEEPPVVTEQRNELQTKLERLTSAREELTQFWAI